MPLVMEPYATQRARWPASGRHILAQFDAASVVVYQAYRPSIGQYAAAHGRFGDGFSLSRMSWVKPNFLWMMYRSGWGTKESQEVVLALRLQRSGFDEILARAVPSSFHPARHASREAWQHDVSQSPVRLQWDPDHDPSGAPVARRAIQLGLRGEVLRRYTGEWLLGIEDVSSFVAEQRARQSRGWAGLETPREDVYPVADPALASSLGLDAWPPA
jgi:Domain of unknown function (DUF4291)